MGGHFASELVKAGLSHLVITGRSPVPVYLSIKNGAVEIRDARRLKGLDTVETQKRIRRDLGAGLNVPLLCRQCRKMQCLEAEDADERMEKRKFL